MDSIVYLPSPKGGFPELKLLQQDMITFSGCIYDLIEALPDDDGLRDVYIYFIDQRFARHVIEGITMIKRGLIPPISEFASFYYNELFISPVEGLLPFYESRGGFDAPNRHFSNVVGIGPALRNLDREFRTCRTLIIYVFSERCFVQSLVPGLIFKRASIVHRCRPDDRSRYLHDETFAALFERHAERLGLAQGHMQGVGDHPICLNSEANGFVGRDMLLYFVDLHSLTPRDANYPDPVRHTGCVVHSEALRQFEIFLILEKHADEL